MASFIPTSLNIQCLFVFFWRKWGGECIWKTASNPLSLFQFTSLPTFQVRQAEGEQKGFATYSDALKPQTLSKLKTDVFLVEMAFRGRLALSMISAPMPHTWYLSFFLHWQNFWRVKLTPKNTNFSRQICKKRHFFA